MEISYSSVPEVKNDPKKNLASYILIFILSIGIGLLVDTYLKKRKRESSDIHKS